jgi:hypothetical protein
MTVPYTWAGSSGLFACEVAIKVLDVTRIVLCGIPMHDEPHFFGGDVWRSGPAYWHEWLKALPHIEDNVRSMSGRTKELLGAPSRQWLTEAEPTH